MRYYSDTLKKLFDSEEELEKAEDSYQKALEEKEEKKNKLASERKARAAEVEDAYQEILKARKVYNEKLDAFIEDYGSFHMTMRTGEDNPFNLFDKFFFFR